MDVSCAFPTALSSPDDIALAESLGYARAWVYDTPQQSPDVWMTLALAAQRTERIGLGPGVLIPSLRHPMVNAAATATLVDLAPGRVAVAFGTGFTGRRAMGYGAITWKFMDAYIRAYRDLLRGEVVEWEGTRMQMLHPDGHAPARPVEVPILVGALGPKGNKVARELGDGLYATLQVPDFLGEYSWVPYLLWGTVLDESEGADSAHAREAAGPGGRWPTTAPTSSAVPTPCAGSPAATRGWTSSSPPPRASGTSRCTPATAWSSTRRTRRPGPRAATRCCATRRSPGPATRSSAASTSSASRASPRWSSSPAAPTPAASWSGSWRPRRRPEPRGYPGGML